MKIKSIKKMKNIGLLNETAYTNCELFLYHNKNDNQSKCYSKNLIKGNNGTGKTTFSNLLYSIEKNDSGILDRLKRIDSSDDINIEIELEDGTIVKYDNSTKQWINTENIIVRVFNEDYIKDNINFEEFDKTNKINGKYETQEVKISIEKNNFENSKNALDENKKQQQALKQELEKEKNDFNTRISTEYDAYCKIDINFDKLDNIPKSEENEKDFDNKLQIFKNYKSAENFKMFFTPNITEIDEKIKTRTIELLEYTEDSTKISFMNEILKESEQKRVWIDKGLTYVEEDNLCPFCKTSLDGNTIIEKYKTYKDSKIKENELALNKCKDYFKQFIENKNVINELNIKINPYISMLKETAISLESNELEDRVNSIIEIIDKKLNDMQNAIDIEELKKLDSYLTDLNIEIEKLKKINQQATDINKKMSSAKKQLTELRKDIKELKIKQFVSSNLEKVNNLLNLKKSETLLFQQFREADKLYKKKLLDSDIVTKEINDWLKFFGLDKYVIDNKFNLNYANNVISNKTFILSTGELSIITFAYFLTTLVTGLTDDEKDRLVIVIDDPVNSIDYNKIYSFATAIKNIQSKIKKNNPPQLFVLTHNILLYNILVQSNFWKNKNAGIFELYKDNNSLRIKKDIHTKDTIFINYLKKIINIAQNESNDVEIENVVIYNCIRTVLENFKYLLNPEYSETGDDETIKEFFELTDEEYLKLDYIINHNSHNEPELSCEPWFDEELLKNCCVVISDMVKKKYSKLYDYCMKK
ncbi:MAG: AAA family ATPase [Clostridia bacterium]|nr:AAA family ATPase [Clostridia bacterium]